MTLGEKIKSLRVDLGLTQADAAGKHITRNMLSAIENDRSLPSLDTLKYLSDRLDVPVSYFVSEYDDLALYRKNEKIPYIKKAFSEKRYSDVTRMVEEISVLDDELAYLLSYSYFELGASAAMLGSFVTAEKHFNSSLAYAKMTVYDTSLIDLKIPLYMSFVKNISSPLLDFNSNEFFINLVKTTDYEFYKYLCNDFEYDYVNELFKKHLIAKNKIKSRKYVEAIELLLEILDSKSSHDYNVYLVYGIYVDLDYCYKQICDFENAYRYSEKRLSMLEGFNS